MKVCCNGALVFTLAWLLGCLHNGVQGQKCCNQDNRRLCFGQCEVGYFQDGNANENLNCPSATTVNPAPSADNSSTTAISTTFSSTTTTITTASLLGVFCSPCTEGCKTCSGSSYAECSECWETHTNHTDNGTSVCKKKDDGYPIPLIVGVTVGSVVVVGLVVGLVIFCCRRRRQRMKFDRDRELGLEIFDDDSTEAETPQQVVKPRGKEGSKENTRVATRKVVEEPTYVNVQSHTQRPFSIEKGHDKVLRYTRDPTVKASKPVINRSKSEDDEVDKLPIAPRPPGSKTPAPPQDVYEIGGDAPADNEDDTEHLTEAPPPPRSHPNPPIEYEDVDGPAKSKPKPATAKPAFKPRPDKNAKPPKSKKPDPSPQPSYVHLSPPMSSRAKKGKPGGNRTTKGVGGAPNKGQGGGRPNTEGALPNPASPVSCSELPKFPMEQAAEETRKKTQRSTLHGSGQDDDDASDPEHEYLNAPDKIPPSRPPAAADSDSDPEADYENDPSLLAVKSSPGKAQGTKNPAAELETEDSGPEEVYGNQDVIDEEQGRQSGKGYYNTTRASASAEPGEDYEVMGGNKIDDDDQPVYGNEVSDEDEPEYENIAAISPRRKT